jgi:hypothetical protein
MGRFAINAGQSIQRTIMLGIQVAQMARAEQAGPTL